MNLILFGPPAAGKGTQAAKLAEKLQIPHLSTGELFRHNITTGTKLGLEAKRYLDAGDLVPSELTNELVDDRLTYPDASDGFILVPHLTPGGLDAFADTVVPLLQERGVYRTEYTGATLRDHLGLG